MKISQLLNEAEDLDSKDLKPSQQLLPPTDEEDVEIDDQDLDDEDPDAEPEDSDSKIEEFKRAGGSIGKDLYSLTMFNYKDDFADIGPDWEIKSILEEFSDNPEVETYLKIDRSRISNRKVIAAVILNARNGETFTFYAGEGIMGFSPSLDTLRSQGTVDADQESTLRSLLSVGDEYQEELEKADSWKAGYDAPNEDVADALRAVKAELNLNEISRNAPLFSIQDYDPEVLDFQKKYAEFKARKREAQNQIIKSRQR